MRRLCGVLVLLAAMVGGPAMAIRAGATGGPTISVKPASVTQEQSSGDAGGVIEGRGFAPNADVKIASPTLSFACPPSDLFYVTFVDAFGDGSIVVTTDFVGSFNVAFGGLGCHPGVYQMTATETGGLHRTASSNFTIQSARHRPKGFSLVPAKQTATDDFGNVATTLVIGGLTPNESITIDSPALNAACTSNGPGSVETAEREDGFNELPDSRTVDSFGNDLITLDAGGCAPGSYPITLTEGSGHVFTANFTIAAGPGV